MLFGVESAVMAPLIGSKVPVAAVLDYFAVRTGETLRLFLKRCAFKHAGVPRKRKYIAMMRRKVTE